MNMRQPDMAVTVLSTWRQLQTLWYEKRAQIIWKSELELGKTVGCTYKELDYRERDVYLIIQNLLELK